MPYNRRKTVGKWGTELITVNMTPIVVPKQPLNKRRFTVWNRMLKRARTIALLGLKTTRAGFALPPSPGKEAPVLERLEWQRWRRAAWSVGNPTKLRRSPSREKYRRGQGKTMARPEEWLLDLLAERAMGKTIRQIAEKYNCASATMRNHLRTAENNASGFLWVEIQRAISATHETRKSCLLDLSKF